MCAEKVEQTTGGAVGPTPGPLHVSKESDDGTFGILLRSGHSVGCAMLEEDARLWAAAPDLLDAAQAVIARWDTPAWKDAEPTARVIARLRYAVAKATAPSAAVTADETSPDARELQRP